MEGTSGAIYGIFLNALVAALHELGGDTARPMDTTTWVKALQSSLEALKKYTRAEPGDRTLMDSLVPFIETFAATQEVSQAARASRKGAEATKAMPASLGRAAYVGGETEWDEQDTRPWSLGFGRFLRRRCGGCITGYRRDAGWLLNGDRIEIEQKCC